MNNMMNNNRTRSLDKIKYNESSTKINTNNTDSNTNININNTETNINMNTNSNRDGIRT